MFITICIYLSKSCRTIVEKKAVVISYLKAEKIHDNALKKPVIRVCVFFIYGNIIMS